MYDLQQTWPHFQVLQVTTQLQVVWYGTWNSIISKRARTKMGKDLEKIVEKEEVLVGEEQGRKRYIQMEEAAPPSTQG